MHDEHLSRPWILRKFNHLLVAAARRICEPGLVYAHYDCCAVDSDCRGGGVRLAIT